MNKPGHQVDAADIMATLRAPVRREIQANGRIRHWGWVAASARWVRVVTEADGETVHTAFWDRSFRP
ncbi:MAG TPA: hypothetical protein VFQ82_11835 [Stellaceae bacterium]|nr:hypothetical protein [Stellaceae bacterium]